MAENAKQASPLAVTLDSIYSNCQGLTPDRISDTPDDQLIFFWAEMSMFTLAGPNQHRGDWRERLEEIRSKTCVGCVGVVPAGLC
ncbi:hypothetical protein GGR58DRAFT_479184 [Xylaria digitata]|nr:hypothetical protein GGR58DRAFT_479184 [Xylaria digitata]